MKNIVFLLGGMLIAFSVYVLWFSTEYNMVKNTTPIKIDKTSNKSNTALIVPASTDEHPSVKESIKEIALIPNDDAKQEDEIANDTHDEEIYRKELEDTGDNTSIPIKPIVKIPSKINITSLLANAKEGKKMKIKAKEKDGIVKVKAMFTNLMVDKEEAAKKKIKAEFITYIVAIANDKIVFESTTSGFMAENPLLKFSFTGAKKVMNLYL